MFVAQSNAVKTSRFKQHVLKNLSKKRPDKDKGTRAVLVPNANM